MDKRATSVLFCMCHKFFVCAFLSRFVAYLWSVVFVVLACSSLPVSLFLLLLSELFAIVNWARVCVWFEIFCVCIDSLN